MIMRPALRATHQKRRVRKNQAARLPGDKDQRFFPLLSTWMDRDGLQALLPAPFLRSPSADG